MKGKEASKIDSALHVNEGVEQPPSINVKAAGRFINKKKDSYSVEALVSGICSGNRTILSKAITLIESSLPSHQEIAQEIIHKCLPFSGNSIRIGITGVPGVGKSSFIESFGKYITSKGHKLAVLAIDPSSTRSKGSILGDKTRMEELSIDDNAFIRPSPSAGSLGGVARKTRESIILCEAAGFDVIIVETVGVGQSETAVHSMVDFFLLLMIAGAGDELQGIKRGIMEMADAVFINKADGDNIPRATISLAEVRNALHFFHPSESGWSPIAELCSARTKMGIPNVWEVISNYLAQVKSNKYFEKRRLEQTQQIMHLTVDQALHDHFYNLPQIKKELRKIQTQLNNGEISAYMAAQLLLNTYFSSDHAG
jgi:LAO/AO transport system kinase